MKKILRFVAFSAVAGSLIFASCKKKDDDSPSYASGWTEAGVTEAKQECIDEGNTKEVCDCFVGKVSTNIPVSEDSTSEISDEDFAKLLQYAVECDYDVFGSEN